MLVAISLLSKNRGKVTANSTAKYGEQVFQFLVRIFGRRNRLSKFGADQLAVPLPKPMNGHFDRSFAFIQSDGDFSIGSIAWLTG
jgi:hypothetical protein